jgi:hypothetical protein
LGPPSQFNPLYLQTLRLFGFRFAERLAAIQRCLFKGRLATESFSS